MSKPPSIERLRSNRWQIIGITLGILATFAFISEADGIWRYVYLFVGGAIGALIGRIAAKIVDLRSKS